MEKSIYSAFGLDINDAELRLVWLDGNGHLRSHNSLELSENSVRHGRIIDPAAFKSDVQKLLREAKGEKVLTRWCAASLPDTHIFMKVIEVPKHVKDRQLEDFVFKNYHEELPQGREELYLSWSRLPVETKDAVNYSFVFGQKKVVDEYVAALRSAGLMPAGLQPDSVAVVNAIMKGGLQEEAKEVEGVKEGHIIVNFRPGYASIVYHDRGQIILISTLRMTALSSDRLISRIDTRIEVGRRWYRQLSGRDLKNVITVGYGELKKKLHESLSSSHGYRVTSGNHYMNVVPSMEEHGESIWLPPDYVTAIGLAENFH